MTSLDRDLDSTADSGVYALGSTGNGHTSEAEFSAVAPTNDSPLGSLRARRQRQQQTLYLDLLVPGWHEDPDDPTPISIYVRCRPARPSDMGRAMEHRKRQGKKVRNFAELAHADALVEACMGVYAIEGKPAEDPATDERPKLSLRDGDETGDWTKFDQDLGYALGLEGRFGAVDVVLALFPTEAQIVNAMNELVRWSGIQAPRDTENFFGD
jgi:hypothetical protein